MNSMISNSFYPAKLTNLQITSYFYSSKVLYDYKLKGKFNHKESFCGKTFKCKITKSGNIHCKMHTQMLLQDIESERELTQIYEDEDTVIYEIENTNCFPTNVTFNVFFYTIFTKLKKDGGLILPGVYIILFDKLYVQKIIFSKKNTSSSKNKSPKLSKYMRHAQPLHKFVKLLVEKDKKLRIRGRKRYFLGDILKFSKYLKIGLKAYAKEGVNVSESFSFNRINLPYDSTWFDFSSELENYCCLILAWFYVHKNFKGVSYDEFESCFFSSDKNISIKEDDAKRLKNNMANYCIAKISLL